MHWPTACRAGLLVAAIACCDRRSPTESYHPALQGRWYWEERFQNFQIGAFCFAAGMLTVAQSNSEFSADGRIVGGCVAGPSESPIDSVTHLVHGAVADTVIHFSIDGCPYGGAAFGGAPDSLTGTVTCFTGPERTLVKYGTWRLLRSVPPDPEPPVVSASSSGTIVLQYIRSALLFDSLHISVHAWDNRGLAWLGYTLSGSASGGDSAAATGWSADRALAFQVAPSMLGALKVTAFARDSAGNRTAVAVDSCRVRNVRAAAIKTVALPGPVLDVAWDAKRDRIYVSVAGSSQLFVIDRASGTTASPIQLPAPGAGLDLSAGGDSLVVALHDRPAVAIVNLVTGTLDTLRLGFNWVFPTVASKVRIAANDVALVTSTIPGWSGYGGQLATVNLATGGVTIRTEVGMDGLVDFIADLARLGDRSRVALVEVGGCCPVQSYLYRAATDGFTGPIGIVGLWPHEVQGSATGGRFLLSTTVFDQDLVRVDSVSDSTAERPSFSALAADGQAVMLSGSPDGLPGFVTVAVGSHAELDRVYVAGWPPQLLVSPRFTALPDGNTLLIYEYQVSGGPGPTILYLVDLRHPAA